MRLPRQPAFWLGAFTLWFGTLWWLSSKVHHVPPKLSFHASDKLMHFGWFLGGAGLLAAALFRLRPDWKPWKHIALCVIIVSLTGVIDEIHQSMIPGRSGNDPADLAADFLGALAGSLIFLPFRRHLR